MNENTIEENPLAELLKAIDKLTTEYQDAHWLHDEQTGDHQIVRVRRQGLLKQLRQSIVGGIGSHGGSSSESERLPFDAHALELYDAIERNITSWFVNLIEQPVHLELEKNLREWFIVFSREVEDKSHSDAYTRGFVRKVEGWVRAIEDKFDPPKRFELTVSEYIPVRDEQGEPVIEHDEYVFETECDRRGRPILDPDTDEPKLKVKRHHPAECPICGAATAYDPKTGDQMMALIIEYRERGNETIDGTRGLCRSCTQYWDGLAGVRQLKAEVDAQETRLNTPGLANAG